MTKSARIPIIALGLTALLLTAAHAETTSTSTYGVVKFGAFLPNGEGDTDNVDEGGLKDFDSGFNAEVGVGFYPAPYAALEFGAGYYRSERNDDTPAGSRSYTLETIPVTATAKFIISNDPFEFGIGAGGGYYFASMDWDVANSSGSTHGTALGYHIVGNADYRVSERVSIGAEIKWITAEPKIDLSITGAGDKKWEIGGTFLNLAAKYRF